MTNQKPAFYAMSFEEIGTWVSRNNFVNGECVFDDDFGSIEDITHQIWAAMQEAKA